VRAAPERLGEGSRGPDAPVKLAAGQQPDNAAEPARPQVDVERRNEEVIDFLNSRQR
jgi:hypothetical protein